MENDPLLGEDFPDLGDEDDEDAILERARRRALGDDGWDEGTRARARAGAGARGTTVRSGESRPKDFVLNQHKVPWAD